VVGGDVSDLWRYGIDRGAGYTAEEGCTDERTSRIMVCSLGAWMHGCVSTGLADDLNGWLDE